MITVPIRGAIVALILSALVLLAGCTGDAPRSTIPVETHPNPGEDVVALPDESVGEAVRTAVEQLPALIESALDQTGVPGLAVAVVHGGEIVYSDGFGVKEVGTDDAVDVDTVFQIASVSKSLSATAVAKAITEGAVEWNTPVVRELPEFAMSDPYVTANATIGDYFSHRTGLATGAGDDLEDLGYDRAYILNHLYLQPLSPFRSTYNYSNFGITVGAEAAAAALGMPWEDAMEELLYIPVGMTSSSSRHSDFLAEPNRATIHTLVDGEFVPLYERDADAQSPAGGVSSTVRDLAAWMNVVLADGDLRGASYIDSAALTAATTGETISGHPSSNLARTSMYGFGFNTGTELGGRTSISHSGAFVLGAATSFRLVPSLNLGIVTLTNGGPQGVPEAINAEFLDLVQFGEVTRDWVKDFQAAIGSYYEPTGDLVGAAPPADAAAPGASSDYTGTYTNDYFGALTVTEVGGELRAALGPDGQYVVTLDAWDGDEFAFTPTGENAPAGSRSSAIFTRTDGAVTSLTMEFFNRQGLGTWIRSGSEAD